MTLEQLQNITYDLYCAHWMLTHQTQDEILDTIMNYHEAVTEYKFTGTFQDYLDDYGFGGEAPACKDEFLETEFMDTNYMSQLIGDYVFNTENLYDIYTSYMNER